MERKKDHEDETGFGICPVVTMTLTSLGFGPAQAAETGGISGDNAIAAQWTNKKDLIPADQKIVLQAEKARFPRNREPFPLIRQNNIGLPM